MSAIQTIPIEMSQNGQEIQDENGLDVDGIPRPIVAKHPLENTWCLWVYRNNTNSFEKNLGLVKDIDTVEDFWSLVLYIKEADKLPKDWGYYFFKKNIRPMWEDNANKAGGRWLINNPKSKMASDSIWREILLCIIGEQFGEYNDQVHGAFVVVKNKADRIGVWTKLCSDADACVSIGKVIKDRTKVHNIIYEAHDSNQKVSYNI